jgi:ParB-like chromosome segregation protein Spo0J
VSEEQLDMCFESDFNSPKLDSLISELKSFLRLLPEEERVIAINKSREAIHEVSPFRSEPVDFVRWVKNQEVKANDYNPNSVAPPEMELLERSIDADGYTQPIVTFPSDSHIEVVDGFHRHRVGKESEIIQKRVKGYLPVVAIRESQEGHNDRVAATIRHNRARGKHKVEAMSDIVLDLKRRNWSNKKIAKELGMDQDEVLRLAQITGLAEMFADKDFSEAWEAETLTPDDYEGDYESLD